MFRESPQKGLQPLVTVLGAETVSGAVVVSLSGLRSALPLVSLSVFPLASLMVSPKVLRLVTLKVSPWELRELVREGGTGRSHDLEVRPGARP